MHILSPHYRDKIQEEARKGGRGGSGGSGSSSSEDGRRTLSRRRRSWTRWTRWTLSDANTSWFPTSTSDFSLGDDGAALWSKLSCCCCCGRGCCGCWSAVCSAVVLWADVQPSCCASRWLLAAATQHRKGKLSTGMATGAFAAQTLAKNNVVFATAVFANAATAEEGAL